MATLRSVIKALLGLPSATFPRAIFYALITGVIIGIPADLIPNPIFGRPIPVGPIDYAIWVTTSALIGLVLAIRAPDRDATDTQTLWSGFVSFLAVGCPVCNQVVVALLGTSGALSWWAPVQPLVGLVAIAIVLLALRRRLQTYHLLACPLPAVPSTPDPVELA